MPRPTLLDRLWSKVTRHDGGDSSLDPFGCWDWTGAKNKDGYGTIKLSGKAVYVHRLAWELNKGPIPPGMLVCHECDNRLCVRIDHLFLGTVAENNEDMLGKGRYQHGERHSLAKLSDKKVARILARSSSQRKFAREFGVSRKTIERVQYGETWKHVK